MSSADAGCSVVFTDISMMSSVPSASAVSTGDARVLTTDTLAASADVIVHDEIHQQQEQHEHVSR